jgi:hypothetical protein
MPHQQPLKLELGWLYMKVSDFYAQLEVPSEGFQFRPRWIFLGVPLFVAGCAWPLIGASLAQDTMLGGILILGSSLSLILGAMVCFIMGTL